MNNLSVYLSSMKYFLAGLAAITVLLGAGVYWSGRDSQVASRSLRAQLPLPTNIEGLTSLPAVTGMATPEDNLVAVAASVTSSEEISTTPQVEGIISEEAAVDVKGRKSSQGTDNNIYAVPVTARTGFSSSTVMLIGVCLLAGSLGLLLAPVVAARG